MDSLHCETVFLYDCCNFLCVFWHKKDYVKEWYREDAGLWGFFWKPMKWRKRLFSSSQSELPSVIKYPLIALPASDAAGPSILYFLSVTCFPAFPTGYSYAESCCSVLAQAGRCVLQSGCHGGTCEVCEPALRIQGISEPWFHDVTAFVALPFQTFYPYYFHLHASWLVLAAWLGGAVLWASVTQLCRGESWWCNRRRVYQLTGASGSSLGQNWLQDLPVRGPWPQFLCWLCCSCLLLLKFLPAYCHAAGVGCVTCFLFL